MSWAYRVVISLARKYANYAASTGVAIVAMAGLVNIAAASPPVQGVGPTSLAASQIPSWSIVSSPNRTPGGNMLSDVSCVTASFCMAVGSSGTGTATLAEPWNGSSWSIANTPPLPTGTSGSLNEVSCPSASFCVAVGNYYSQTASGSSGEIADTWNGSSWSIANTPPLPTGTSGFLSGVSCPSAGFCMAVGNYYSQTASGLLADTWNGSAWSAVAAPTLPTGTNSGSLSGVYCQSANFCMVVGSYYNSSGGGELADTWNGSAWSAVAAPAFPTGTNGGSLNEVSCPSASFCMAVGSYYTSSGMPGEIANTWNGSSWSAMAVPALPTGTNGSLNGVYCPSAGFCMVVGNYYNSSGSGELADTWNGSSWSAMAVPTAPTGSSYSLYGLSCTSTTFCVSVGTHSYPGSTTQSEQTLVESGSLPSPPTPELSGVSPNAGPTSGDTQVTITGTNLSGATAVDFGSNKATSFTVNSSTLITATSPPGSAGDVAVTVTTPEGTSSNTLSCGDIFTYGATSQAAQSGSYNPISPFRLADTRPGSGEPYAGKTLSACGTLDIQAIGVSGSSVPVTGVAGVIVNVTAVDPGGSGYLTVYPAGSVRPEASNLNFESGKTVANLVDVGVSQAGEIAIYNGSAYPTNVVVDIAGYYSSTGQLYTPISPLRVCDTRQGNPSKLSGLQAQCNGHSLVANVPLTVDLTGTGLLPQGAQAAVVNLTVINPTGGGYLTAYPASLATAPTASNLNFQKGELISNRATVTLPSTGQIDIVSNTSTNVVVDVGGYYSTTGSSYTPLSPTRIADSRCTASPPPSFCAAEQIPSQNAGFSALGPGSTSTLTVAGIAGVPLTATAVVLNMTVTATTKGSFLTVWPGGNMPTASDLNWSAGTTIPNLVVVEVSSGKISLYNNAGSVQVICDVEGWYG